MQSVLELFPREYSGRSVRLHTYFNLVSNFKMSGATRSLPRMLWWRAKGQLYSYLRVKTKCLLYAFFWFITRRLEFICRRFGTLCLVHLHRQVDGSRKILKYQTSQKSVQWETSCFMRTDRRTDGHTNRHDKR